MQFFHSFHIRLLFCCTVLLSLFLFGTPTRVHSQPVEEEKISTPQPRKSSTKRTTSIETKNLEDPNTVDLGGDDERLRPSDAFQMPIGKSLLTITGAFRYDTEFRENFNLRSTREENELIVTPKLTMDFIFSLPQGITLFTEFRAEDEAEFKQGSRSENTFDLRVRAAFADIPLPLSIPSALRVGRQQIFEPRRWLLNNQLDAIRFLIAPQPFFVSLFVASPRPSSNDKVRIFQDIFDNRDQVDFMIDTTYALSEGSTLGQYVIFGSNHENRIESGNPREEDPIWIGFRAYGKETFDTKLKWLDSDFLEDLLRPKIRYWVDVALVTGSVKSNRISGFALDLGATYIARKLPLDPYVTMAYAFGTGDRDPNDGVDRNFRQTGFQSNSGKFGGVVNFDYYGVVIEPELSNLQVLTLGIGLRPSKKSSVDLVYHHYSQHHAFDELRDTNLDGDPRGRNTNLGHEIDLVLGYRELKNLRFRFRSGYFIPGSAFRRGRDDPAFGARFDVQFSF